MLENCRRRAAAGENAGGHRRGDPLPDESVDAVVCAQSFHWFATPQALAEISILKPGGKLGLVGTCAMRASVECVN